MRPVGVVLLALFVLSLPGWGSTGEWKGTAEIEIISDVAGISEESLDIATDASLELFFDGLDIEIIPSFDELISDVRRVKISDVFKVIEGIEALKDDVKNIKISNINENFRLELLNRLNSIQIAIKEDRFDETISQLREFRCLIRKAYEPEPGEEKKLKRKSDANKLRSKAKTAIRNINNIEGLKEDVIDFTCIPFGSASELDCIPVDLATGLKTILDMAKDAVEHHQNAMAAGWLLDFIGQVEEEHSEGYIISKEADSLISKAETIIGKIDKGKSESDLEINISATIAEVELIWELETEGAIFPAPGKDNRDITFNFEADVGLDDLDLTLEMAHQRLDFFERWTKEKGKLVDGLNFEAGLDLGDLELTRALSYERAFFPEGVGEEIERARVNEARQDIERMEQEIEGSSSIPSETEDDLIEKLQDALAALDDGQRDEAVDDLWDFIELVERRRREEKISEDDANWLVTEAREILPRKRIRVSTTTTKAGLDLDDLELGIECESTIKDLPTETKKDERSTNIKGKLEVERAPLSLKGTIERQRKLFPNDRKKR